MTTTLERMATEPRHDPSILLPNVWSGTFRNIDVLCPCGSTASVRDGRLEIHEPKAAWDREGQRRAVIADAYATGVPWAGCRYTGRTVTLAAALERDEALTDAERHVRDVTERRLRAGITDTAPDGFALPKPVAALFALAEANGWRTAQAWGPRDDGFLANFRVGRPGGWQYDFGYLLAPGTARRTRSGLCCTPDHRGPRDTPSLKAITAVIRANPVEG